MSASETRLSVAEFGDDQFGGVGVDRLVDGRHHAHFHQRLDHVGAALGHAVGKFLDGDGLGNGHLAQNLFGRLGNCFWRSRSLARLTAAS